jgi:hypothetical protein
MTKIDIQLNEKYKKLLTKRSADLNDAFVDYCRTVMAYARRGQLSNEIAGRYIARTMFIPAVENNPAMEATTMYAGDLEVPRDPAEQAELWARIESELLELCK